MRRVLITGATGVLGQELIAELRASGRYAVRAASRAMKASESSPDIEWVRVDLTTGEGLSEAVRDVEVVIHAATSPDRNAKRVDVEGIGQLLREAKDAGVRRIVYPSIVGVDRIPLSYYRHNLAAEKLIEAGGMPFTIHRFTHFHTFVDGLLGASARLPVIVVPKSW
jgi:nucleoside-diphosphate-sugar epimerase